MTKELLEKLKRMNEEDYATAEYCAMAARFWTAKSKKIQQPSKEYDECLRVIAQYGIQAQNTKELADFMKKEIEEKEAELNKEAK